MSKLIKKATVKNQMNTLQMIDISATPHGRLKYQERSPARSKKRIPAKYGLSKNIGLVMTKKSGVRLLNARNNKKGIELLLSVVE